MKKLLSVSGLLVGAALAFTAVVANVTTQESASAAPKCTVKSVGPRDKAFNVSNYNATVKFKVSGKKDCKVKLIAWANYAPSMNGKPYNQQVRFDTVVRTFGKGTHQMTVKLPTQSDKKLGCFYQVDLDYYPRSKPVLAYGHGKLNCEEPKEKKVKVCDLESKQIIKINEKDFNPYKHSRDLNDCKEEPEVPGDMQVCELATGDTITIKENEFDASKHSEDFNDCEEEPVTPETPVEETPEELPQTGPMTVVMQLLGAGSLAASVGYYLQSRRFNS